MPYIKSEEREQYLEGIENLLQILREPPLEKVSGHLNFIITTIVKRLYHPRYFNYNRAVGVLEAVKLEFYRRCVTPYEDKKIEENGDVY